MADYNWERFRDDPDEGRFRATMRLLLQDVTALHKASVDLAVNHGDFFSPGYEMEEAVMVERGLMTARRNLAHIIRGWDGDAVMGIAMPPEDD